MANYIVQKESLETVADSIRAKAGISEKLEFPLGWKAAVEGIEVGGADNSRKNLFETVVNVSTDTSVFLAEEADGYFLYGGVRLPKIPVYEEYPYALIYKNASTNVYYLTLCSAVFYVQYTSKKYIVRAASANGVRFSCREGVANWLYLDDTANLGYTLSSSDTVHNTLTWANEDVLYGSATATTVHFAGSEPVPTE